jgi:hypothetical protein
VPQKQRPRGRLWLGDGSCVRLRPERANHVWSYDGMTQPRTALFRSMIPTTSMLTRSRAANAVTQKVSLMRALLGKAICTSGLANHDMTCLSNPVSCLGRSTPAPRLLFARVRRRRRGWPETRFREIGNRNLLVKLLPAKASQRRKVSVFLSC